LFFILSKTVGLLLLPTNFLIVLALAGALLTATRWARAGRRLMATTIVLLAVCAFSPAGNLLLYPLESRFPPWDAATNAPPAESSKPGAHPKASAEAQPAPPVAMEDWWLARDSKGHAGWLLSRMIDVDAPDTLTRYSEGQKFVGAYVLATVFDAGAEQQNKNIPEYVTVLAPYTAGLPFDFNQVRVFTWNVKMHRYETAFREKNIAGYLPVKLELAKDPYGKSPTAQTALPAFTYRVLTADAPPVVPDPATGFITPGKTIAKMYRLEGNVVHRVAPPGYKDPPIARPMAEINKEKKGRRR